MRIPMLSPSRGLFTMRRIRWRLARYRHCREFQLPPPITVNGRCAGHRNRVPVYAAVVLKNRKQRIPGREIFARHLGGIDFQGLAFTEHEQPRRVIDLCVHQHDASHGGIAHRTRRSAIPETHGIATRSPARR